MRTLLGPWVVGAMLLFQGHASWAQTPYPECSAEPTDGDVAAAKGAFQAGQASFNEADYARAIDYWEDAYRRDCTAHALLLNLARAYELNGNKPQAVEALRTYLARKPETPQKDQIQRRIEVLNQQIAAEPPAPAAPPPEEKPKEKQRAEPAPAKTEPAKSKPEPESNHWVGPVILGGVGVVAATTGIIVHTIGSRDEQEAEEACPSRLQCDPAIEEKGNSGIFKQKLGVGLIIGGAAAVGGSVAWYFLSAPDAPATTPRDTPAAPPAPSQTRWYVLPEAAPGYAGLTAIGSF